MNFRVNSWPTKGTPWITDKPLSIPYADKIVSVIRKILESGAVWVQSLYTDHYCGLEPRYYNVAVAVTSKIVVIRYTGGVWEGYAEVLLDDEHPVAIINNPCDGWVALRLLHDLALLSLGADPCRNGSEFMLIIASRHYCRADP